MNDKTVRSSLSISRDMADYLETVDPQNYHAADRAKTIQHLNDILAGRSKESLTPLISTSTEETPVRLMADFSALSAQIEQMARPFPLRHGRARKYPVWDGSAETPLKWIDQKRYDNALKNGFPTGFFENSYFDHICFSAVPDEMTCRGSTFDGCQFTACRIHSAFFEDCTVQDTDFSNCRLCLCLFAYSNIAHTRFFDCQLCRHGGFAFSQLKNVLFRDCNMDAINIGNCTLDGCSFARMRVKNIHRLETSTITQGGATPEECERLRVQTYQSLGVSIQKHRLPRNKER